MRKLRDVRRLQIYWSDKMNADIGLSVAHSMTAGRFHSREGRGWKKTRLVSFSGPPAYLIVPECSEVEKSAVKAVG